MCFTKFNTSKGVISRWFLPTRALMSFSFWVWYKCLWILHNSFWVMMLYVFKLYRSLNNNILEWKSTLFTFIPPDQSEGGVRFLYSICRKMAWRPVSILPSVTSISSYPFGPRRLKLDRINPHITGSKSV